MPLYITITGQKHYYGLLPFVIGASIQLRPEPDNLYDPDAVAVYASVYGKAGYVAQASDTMAEGTISASTLRSMLPTAEKAIIRFIAGEYIIAEIL